jgi:hypothetical protein
MLRRLLLISLLIATSFFSPKAHAVFIQIHFNRPIVNDPNVIVMTFFDNEMLGPYHVAIYNTPFGSTEWDLLYMESFENIRDANAAHMNATEYAHAMFPNVESPEINLMLGDTFIQSIVHPTVSEAPIPHLVHSIPPRVSGPLSTINETKKSEPTVGKGELYVPKHLKTFKKASGCNPKHDRLYDEEKKDGDEDHEEMTMKNMPNDFTTVTLTKDHVQFFK